MLVNTDPEHETLPPPPPVSETSTEPVVADKIAENIKVEVLRANGIQGLITTKVDTKK